MKGASLPALGVTAGKFYPFHLGHDHLIRSAKAQVERLVVIVGHKPDQELSGATRAEWIRREHPDVEVLLALEDIPNESEPWAARTLELLGRRRPDLAFTSEAYGEAWARAMKCDHVSVDAPRATVPTSGTALRADLGAHWAFLTPACKAHFARRVVVVGVESSGTTTLARDLARHYATAWVSEYGRAYWEGRRHLPDAERWTGEEFVHIAAAQSHAEDALARLANRLLVCDTDALATHVWRRRYLGSDDPRLVPFAAARRRDLYLLTAPDFPFVQDGTRESEHLREGMHADFVQALEDQASPWRLVEGAREARLQAAVKAIDPLLRFAPLADPA